MSHEKKRTTAQIFEAIEKIANILPAPLYWLDVKGVILGANDVAFKLVGGWNARDNIIGKEHHNFYPKEVAEALESNNNKVIQTGQTVEFEEAIVDMTTNKPKYLMSIRSPLRNDDGEIIGIIGTSIDITDKKEAALLQNENIEQRTQLQAQKKFTEIANQLSHDIRSPLAAAKIWFESIQHKLSEGERVMGRNALERTMDIVNSGFVRYKPNVGEKEKQTLEEKKPMMLYLALEQILAEKRLEYKQKVIMIDMACMPSALFAFLKIQQSTFKRMVSNLINNAVDALEKRPNGKVTLYLNADEKNVTLTIEDNGEGISDEVKKCIINHEKVTSGKEHGNGIGFMQIWNTLKDNDGQLLINSTIGVGTRIDIIFPRCSTPHWVIERLIFSEDHTIVIIDDDSSIHDAWNSRFQKMASVIDIKHFQEGNEAVDFLNTFPHKNKLFLLTDYELLNQALNGLDIIEKTQIEKTILVTSHAEDEKICDRALTLNTKILPKQLVASIPIEIQKSEEEKNSSALTEVVVMDDDCLILESVVPFLFSKRNVEAYLRPQECLARLSHYSKDTVFFIDHHYGVNSITGLDVAKKLHAQGFHRLYLLTGDSSEINAQSYLHVILKTDIEHLKKVVDACFPEKEK